MASPQGTGKVKSSPTGLPKDRRPGDQVLLKKTWPPIWVELPRATSLSGVLWECGRSG